MANHQQAHSIGLPKGLILTIAANTLYNICQKATSSKVNPILSLIVTYLIASLVSVIVFLFYPKQGSISSLFKELNWASFALGFAIIGLELGFLLAYRTGWSMSIGVITSNSIVTLILIPIGILFFQERISFVNAMGILLCMGGLVLMNYK